MRKRSELFKSLLPFLISCLILYFLFHKSSFASAFSNLKGASFIWVSSYFIMAAVEPVIRGVRWHYLLRQGNISTAVRGIYISKAGNNLLPFRIGDLVRTQYVKDMNAIPYSISISSILVEIFLDLLCLAILAIGYTIFDPSFSSIGYIMLSILLIVGLLCFILFKSNLLQKYAGSNKIVFMLLRTLNGVYEVVRSKNILPVLLVTFLLWCFTILLSFTALRMLLPDVTFSGVVATIVFTYLAATIPSAPGFIGTYHAAIAAGILVMGYSISDYPAVPILVHIVQYIPQTIIGSLLGFNYLFKKDWGLIGQQIFRQRSKEKDIL